ncbi:hypothetical protein ABK040_008581 [Willaertia magna]
MFQQQQKEINNNSLSLLPNEILFYISEYFNKKDFINFSMTCKFYFQEFILNNNYSFKQLLKNISFSSLNSIESIPEYITKQFTIFNICLNNARGLNLNKFINLEELYLTLIGIDTSDEDLYFLENLKNLKKLHIDGEPILYGKYLQNINLLNLTEFVTHCEGIKSEYLQNLKNLKNLTIKQKIKGDVKFLENLTNLETLYLSLNNLNNIELPITIKKLQLYKTNITDFQLHKLINLKYLQLVDENITGECFYYLENLEIFRFYNLKFNSEHLNALQNLKELYFYGSVQMNELELENIEKLIIQGQENITDNNLKHLIKLTELTIVNCNKMEGTCFNSFKKLKILKTDIQMKDDLLKECNELEYFNFKNINDLQGDFLNYLTKIKYLSFGKYTEKVGLRNKEWFNEFKLKAEYGNNKNELIGNRIINYL